MMQQPLPSCMNAARKHHKTVFSDRNLYYLITAKQNWTMYCHRPGKVQKSKRQYAYVTPRNVGQLFLQIFIEFGLLVTPMSVTDRQIEV